MPTKREAPGPVTKRVAARLRMRLADLRWTQQELARASGVASQSHLSQILAGNRHIYLDQLARICDAMDLDLPSVVGKAESVRDELYDDLNDRIASTGTGMPDKDQSIESESDIA